MARVWQLQEAKNKFSEVVEEAISHGPQIITKHGIEAVIPSHPSRLKPAEMDEETCRDRHKTKAASNALQAVLATGRKLSA